MLRIQTRILRDMAAGKPPLPLAELLCHLVRHHAPDRIASLTRIGPDGLLHPVAAAGAPASFLAACDGVAPGPHNGSCAAAFHQGVPVLVEDAAHDPRWAGQRAVAATHGIRACWSYPVRQGARLIGAFTLTGTVPGAPGPALHLLVQQAAAIAGSILQLLDLREDQGRQAARLRRLTGFNAMLAQVNQLAASRPDTAALYEGVCRIAVAQAGLRLVWIGVPDRAGRIRPVAAAGATGFLDDILVSTDPALPEGRGLSGTAWREARTVVRQRFAPGTILAPWLGAARRHGLGAGTALPLLLRGVPQAVLHVSTAEEGILDAELVGLIEELAVDVGRALEALDQQRHLDRLQALHTVLLTEGEVLLQARSEAEMLRETCIQLGTSTLFHVTWIARPDAEGVLRMLAGAGPGIAGVEQLRLALDDDPAPLVVQGWHAGRAMALNDLPSGQGLAQFCDMFAQGGWQSTAVVPIARGGAQFAVLLLGSPHLGLFTPDVLALCERIAQLLGRGLDELDLKQTLEQERSRQFHLARHDPLTGLPNRLLFEEHLGHALERARRRGDPLAVCLLDMDDFKPINDRWGHHAGDSILRQTATRLRDTMRRSDLVARLGGDEFVLAIEDLGSLRSLPGLLGRLSEVIEAPFDLGSFDGAPSDGALSDGALSDGASSDRPLSDPAPCGRRELQARISLSVGVAVFPEDGEDPDLLLRRADAALYAAKSRKTARERNWHRWSADLAQPSAPTPGIDDPYGVEARRLLAATADIWPGVTAGFIDEFYHGLARRPAAAPILAALAPEELARLKTRQAAHLIALMAAAADRSTLRRLARAVGEVHALVGVEGALMMQAIGIYQARLTEGLAAQALRPIDRQNLLTVAISRLQEDSAVQMEARADTIAAYFDVLLRRPPPPGTPWVDATQAQLDALAGLPGILATGLLRPDAEGRFQVLASSSAVGLSFARIREVSEVVPLLDAARPEGQGLMAEAWRSGEVVIAANFQTDPRTAPWHPAARQFGMRSAAVMPVRDADDRLVAALILFGAVPGQFVSMWMRHFCIFAGQAMALLWRQRCGAVTAAVVPETTAAAWRRRLFTGGLRLHYQPLVGLRDGLPVKAEALARLVQDDG
ncbi:MAG: GAF domain-containing protein, partial [Acetobacteraceae bacterium]